MDAKRGQGYVPIVDLWKFIYAWFIVIYHIYNATGLHLKGGYYAVEFYLLAAGVFFFRGLERRPDIPPSVRIGKRFLRFFPWAFSAFIFAFIVIRVMIDGDTTLSKIASNLSGDVWEILLVDMTGLNGGSYQLNVPAWTLSSMFLVEILMLGFYQYKKSFVHIVLPLTLMAGFGFWRNMQKVTTPLWVGFTSFGTLRAWLVYGCAYYCLKLAELLQKTRLTHLAEVLLTALETLCHVFAILTMFFCDTRYWHYCALLAFFVALTIEMSGHSLWNAALQRFAPVTGILSAFSLSIYLIHRPITRYFEMLYPAMDVLYAHVLPMLAVILVCSLIHYVLISGLIRLCRAVRPKLAAALLSDKSSDGV